MKTIKHLGGTQPNLPSVPLFLCTLPSSPSLPPSLLSLSLTDDNSVGVRGHGLTEKGIISCDNHRRTETVNNPLAAENNNRRGENFSKAHAGLGFRLQGCSLNVRALCTNAESAVQAKGGAGTLCAAAEAHCLLIPTRLPRVCRGPETHKRAARRESYHCSAPVEVKGALSFSGISSQTPANYKELMGIIVPSVIAGIF